MRHRHIAALALSAIFLATRAFAAEADAPEATNAATASPTTLPAVTVTADRVKETLTVPDTAQATANAQRTPGGVAVIADTQFKETRAQTIKDVVDWVPGVFAQARFGDDARVSIRGSGLSRNYGNRGINVYMDGIPINTSDGLVDLFEIDPSAYRYVEIFKGANGMRYGANSLGGAINFVTPTGRDASALDARLDTGSFGYVRGQVSSGGYSGAADWFGTASAWRADGYRDHSDGHEERASGNFGMRISNDVETRFYLNVNSIRQRLPGEVSKDSALKSPKTAESDFVLLDQQRNIDSVRIANKTTIRFDQATLDVGLFSVNRHVMHPIYQYLDYRVQDYGGFLRMVDEHSIGGFRNRLIVGANVLNGSIDNNQFVNNPGAVKGALVVSNLQESKNDSVYFEDSFYVLQNLSLIAGTQFLHASRNLADRLKNPTDISGSRSFNLWTPKAGVLWDVDAAWQVFANVSRSAEVPTYDANTFASPASSNVDAQTATTYEIGTRGHRQDFNWDLSVYRAQIHKELQCLTLSPYNPCTVTNADRTVHQGVEAGLGFALLDSVLAKQDQLRFNAAYTFSDFFFHGDTTYGDNKLPGAPMHYLRAEVLYKHPSGLSAGPNVEWMPKAYFADNENKVTVDPYALLNFKVSYDGSSRWSGYVEGRNLFDRRYIGTTAVAGSATNASELFDPGIGLAFYTGVQYRW